MTIVNRLRASSFPVGSARRVVRVVVAALIDRLDCLRQYRHLRRLDDRMLKDIGLIRADVHRYSGWGSARTLSRWAMVYTHLGADSAVPTLGRPRT